MVNVVVAALLVVVAVAASTASSQETGRSSAPLVVGLDHIPVAVTDLDAAAERYRQLGFTLKPGRPHDNGIRNQHAKFPDGTEIELITAPDARDALTSRYVAHLAQGDGPAFLALYVPEAGDVDRQLEDRLRYIFFGQRNSSPTDRPDHFKHANGAEALIGVWIAGDDCSAEQALLRRLGASIGDEDVHVPESARRVVARLSQAEVIFLPGSRQLVPGRRVVGATVRTRSLAAVRGVLATGPLRMPPVVQTKHGRSIFLSPDVTHGMWLEFREGA